MVGYSTIGLQSYGLGPFVTHLEQAFGWSRAEVMTGLSLSNLAGVFLNIGVGIVVDRIGPRPVGLTGLVVKTGAFALLATATGSLLNWSMLWLVLAIGVVLLQSSIWTRAVAGRFDRSRGLAMAVVLSGTPITAMVLPLLATFLIEAYGWRTAFVGIGLAWFLVSFPIVYFLYRDGGRNRGGASQPARPAEVSGVTVRQGLRTRAFVCLTVSFGAFSFYNMTITASLVPLLTEKGISALEAAGVASLMGIVGIVARLSVGFLLDRMPGGLIGAVTQLLPVIGCALLLFGGSDLLILSLAVAAFGAATGAEVDVALYLATRHFGLRSFVTLFNVIITFGALNAGIGPYIGGWLHDVSGSYAILLMVIMGVMAIGAAAMAVIGEPVREG
jgi:cyanate permease